MEVLDLITGQNGFVKETRGTDYYVMLRNLHGDNEIDSVRWFKLVPFLKRFKILKIEEDGYNTKAEMYQWAEDHVSEWFGNQITPDSVNRCDTIEYYRHSKPNKIFKIKWTK